LARGFIKEIGRDPGPGQAVLYGTTTLLLERLGLDAIEDLPPLAQFVPGPEVMDALERSLRADRTDRVDPEGPAEPPDPEDGPADPWESGPAAHPAGSDRDPPQ
jgi:segregation and condensation protein B